MSAHILNLSLAYHVDDKTDYSNLYQNTVIDRTIIMFVM